jgi:hypothetical protein
MTDAISELWWRDDENNKKCIGSRGGNYATQRIKKVWALESFTLLTWPCWLNSCGG